MAQGKKKTKKKERTLVVEGETEKETREGELWKMWKRTKGCIGWRRKKKMNKMMLLLRDVREKK